MQTQRTLFAAVFGLAFAASVLMPATGEATIIISTEPIPPGCTLCDQSVNFTPANSGTTVFGDTNPAPVYDVSATSNVTLHGSGSTVDTGVGGPGFDQITFNPLGGFAWTAFEFQLDSLDGNIASGANDLTIIATDQFGNTFTDTFAFPWEGNTGENQHYFLTASLGELITSVEILYNGGPDGTNTIQDIHNIDVGSALLVPEPNTLLLLGTALVGFAFFRRRRRSARL